MAPEKKFDAKSQSFFVTQSPGVLSSRESWVYNFSKDKVANQMDSMISFYESQRIEFSENNNAKKKVEDYIDTDAKKISWTRALRKDLSNNVKHKFKPNSITEGILRPYYKLNLYNDRNFIESPGLLSQFFPKALPQKNVVICVSGLGANKQNCILAVDSSIDYNAIDAGAKCFPLYYYEEREKNSPSLFDATGDSEYIRRDGVSDFILVRAKQQYGKNVTKEDVFYYVYGFLHSKEYRETFANDLKKMLPRLPLVEDVKNFWAFSKAGRKLAELHINYEEVPPYDGVEISGDSTGFFRVEKMRFPKKKQKETIIYNSRIQISNIPAKAYEYVVNGKSAIEWIMERYQVTVDKASGIKNDPNDWADEVGNPRYILDLLLSIINVSVQTVDIVNGLPKLDFNIYEPTPRT